MTCQKCGNTTPEGRLTDIAIQVGNEGRTFKACPVCTARVRGVSAPLQRQDTPVTSLKKIYLTEEKVEPVLTNKLPTNLDTQKLP